MKICPKCGAQYENETIVFCTRDGMPLVPEANEPEFTDMPSESWEEQTVITSKPAGEKIVVPTTEADVEPVVPVMPPPGRIPPYQPPPKPRIALTILLSVICTIAVIAIAIFLWWVINGGSSNMPANGNF